MWPFDRKPTPPPSPEATALSPASHSPEIGSVNVLECAVGLRGYGKSTKLCMEIVELSGRHTSYVIGHSLGARLPDRLPDGSELPIVYHASMRDLEKGLRNHPGKWHIKVGGKADEVILYARALSVSLRKKAWADAGKIEKWTQASRMLGMRAPLVILLIDEGIAAKAAGAGAVKSGKSRGKPPTGEANDLDGDDWFLEWVFSIRHEHTAVFWGIQNANARSWYLLDQATRIYVVRTRHEWAIQSLRSAGLDQDELAGLPHMERGEVVVIE